MPKTVKIDQNTNRFYCAQAVDEAAHRSTFPTDREKYEFLVRVEPDTQPLLTVRLAVKDEADCVSALNRGYWRSAQRNRWSVHCAGSFVQFTRFFRRMELTHQGPGATESLDNMNEVRASEYYSAIRVAITTRETSEGDIIASFDGDSSLEAPLPMHAEKAYN